MGKIHGKDGTVQVSDNDVLEVTSWSLDESANVAEGSAMGDNYTTNLGGIKSNSGTVECNYDKDDTNGQQALAPGATVALSLFPEPDATDANFWGGNAIIESVSHSTPHDGIVTASFSFRNADSTGILAQTVGE